MKRHPIRTLAAAALTAALLAPAAASARPDGWTPPPPPGDGTSEVQTGQLPQNTTEPDASLVLHTSLVTLRHSERGVVGFGDPPVDEPQDVVPPKKDGGDDEQSIQDAINARNRAFGDALGDEAARREMMNRLMGGMLP